ncbi:MAG: prenyltransferase/squalene oxidase repeat-containing protein [Candidatus Bathyarchaeia archaeon]
MKASLQQASVVEPAYWARHVLEYVTVRQNPDGGYNFARGVESSAQDTYYALAIFNALHAPAPHLEATVRWLEKFPADNIYAYFYVAKGLLLSGRHVDDELVRRVLSLRRPSGGFGDVDVDVEAYSEFDATYRATEILRELKVSIDSKPTVEWLLKFLNPDGGFGAQGGSNLISTFHAVAALRNLDYPVNQLAQTLRFVRSCEKPDGGFTSVPNSALPYLEETYAGVSTLHMMGETCTYPEATRGFVLKLQNSNGGFRRSFELGISTFEDTYYALSILRILGTI